MEALPANLLTGSQLSALMIGLGIGLVYAVWFKLDRGALHFLWLMWFALGLGLQQTFSLPHDFSRVIYNGTPWNFALLALLPAVRLRSAGAAALVAFVALQLAIPFVVDPEKWNQLPGLNEMLFGWLAEMIGSDSPLPPLMIVAFGAFFVRWQLTDRITDLGGCIVVTLLLGGLMRPEYLSLVIAIAGVVMMVAVLYSSHRIAFVDALTGIRNRRSMDAAMQSTGRRYAIGMLDVDHFKRINDRFGHDFGDQVLKAVATRIKQTKGFQIYRYGGEEFCMLFTGSQVDKAEVACEAARCAVGDLPIAMRSGLRPPHRPIAKGKYREKVPSVKVTVSIGLAISSDKYANPGEVREAADKALYRAKKNGRNRVSVAR